MGRRGTLGNRALEVCGHPRRSSTCRSGDRAGIQDITGMVFDGDDLMVIDGPSAQIVCIPAALL